MFSSILVPLDGSKTAEMVLPYVTSFILKTDTQVNLIRVDDKNSTVLDSRLYLENVARDIANKIQKTSPHKINIKTDVLFFNPVDAIINYASENQTKLIIIASRGASNQPRWPLGNVAQKILRTSKIPVLIVKNPPDDYTDTIRPLIKRILLPLDGSKLSENAIPYAVGMAQLTDSELILTQVIQHIEAPTGSPATGIKWQVSDYEGYLRTLATGYLNKIAGNLQNSMKNVTIKVLTGSPAEQIVEYSENNGIDLIVMSSHGRSGVSRWFFGSVTEKILNGVGTPVLVIRQV